MALLDYGYRFSTDHTVIKAGPIVGTYNDTSLDPDEFPISGSAAASRRPPDRLLGRNFREL